MSGIAGIYRLDGRPVDPLALGRMAGALAHRGPDHQAAWVDGPLGLAQCLLHTTAESLDERLPLHTGPTVLVADARLDNREALLGRLSLGGSVPDGGLIAAAYARWGRSCVEHLLGDFAFVLWDGSRRELFAARDGFGVRPLYYHHGPGRVFVFASEVKALLQLEEVPRPLNEVHIADYLAGICLDKAATFYRYLWRLPPGHYLTVGQSGFSLQAYWRLDPPAVLRLPSARAYADAFRDVFTEAVRCRLRSARPVAAMLSGGLDSSSITCLARHLLGTGERLLTFSAVFDEVSSCDERPYIEAVLAQGGCTPHYLRVDGPEHRPLRALQEMLRHQDEPFFAPNASQPWHLYKAISQHHLRVVLDGHGGDETVGQGFGYLTEMAQQRRWMALARELWPLARAYGEPFWRPFLGYIRHGIRAARPGSPGLFRRIGGGLLGPLYRTLDGQTPDLASQLDLVAPALARRTRLEERYRAWRRNLPQAARSEREHHVRLVDHPSQTLAFEVLDKLAMAFSVEPRYPFWDRRVVQFCLSLPPEQKLHRGWGRFVLRRSLEGIVPREVQWRRSKADFTPYVRRGLKVNEPLASVMQDYDLTGDFVNVGLLRSIQGRFNAGEASTYEVHMLLRAVALKLWLKPLTSTPLQQATHVYQHTLASDT